MRTDEYLRKLQPLMPGRVRHWRAALDVVDDPTRRLLAQHIATIAHQHLHDPRDLLLSLPPPDRAKGALHVGTIRYDTPQWAFGLHDAELLQHVAIFGRSGAGKTNVVFHLLEQLVARGTPFVFLDWKRTARHLLPRLGRGVRVYTPGRSLSPLPFNAFIAPPGLDAHVYAHHVVDVLASAYTLGDGAKSLVYKALTAHERPTPASVLASLRSIPDQERVRSWKISAVRALESLAATNVLADGTRQEEMVSALLEHPTIIELDGLSPSTKAFFVPLWCLWVYHTRLCLPARETLKLVVIVEEAHHVLYAHRNARETTMELLLRQCRELGIGIIVVDQHPHLLSSAAIGNTYTSLCLNLKDPKDLATAARLSLLPADDAHHLSTLPPGRAVVKLQDRWHHAFVVDVPLVPVAKGSVTDDSLRAYLRGATTLSGLARPQAADFASLGRPRPADEERFLHDVGTFPDDGVDARYHRLGMSADAGTRLKRRLLALELVQEERVRSGRTSRTLLRLTPRATDLPTGQHRHESLMHEYWKRWYAHHYRTLGYSVAIEAPRPAGGRADVLATRGRESVAIEVETGKSDVVANVRNDLRSGYTRVLVVATTDGAWVRVWQALQRAGLILPQVTVVLREGKARTKRLLS